MLKNPSESFDTLKTNRGGIEIIEQNPFMLRVSKHEYLFFSNLLVSCPGSSMKNSATLLCHSRGSGNPEFPVFPGFRLAPAVAGLAGMTLRIIVRI